MTLHINRTVVNADLGRRDMHLKGRYATVEKSDLAAYAVRVMIM